MLWWEKLAEERIQEAIRKGEFDHLPGKGKPLPRDELEWVPEELRMAYRILKNSGHLPEEVLIRREIAEVTQLLAEVEDHSPASRRLRRRLRFLIERLGELGNRPLWLEELYYRKLVAKLAGET